jgi:type I restriction enzyme, R subunit
VHYYWNLDEGNPVVISKFLKLQDFARIADWQPRPEKMSEQVIDENYIAVSQDARWLTYSKEQKQEVQNNNKIRLLRGYQIEGAQRLQKKYSVGQRRFLFEMATGTGKTLLSAAIIKMFIRSSNADRVLFLVDRMELENQAFNDLKGYLEKDGIKSVIYRQTKTDWADAQVVITTIQSLSYENRYLTAFAPTDFQLIISDEAHRTIGGNNRIVFEYFIGAKLGLTATPRDYLKGVDRPDLEGKDPRQLERRLLLDTYNTFGCGDQVPTFRFSLEDAVKGTPPYLCMPKLLDIRTDITTDLLSKAGWTYKFQNQEGDDEEDTYQKRDFMKKFFSQETNKSFVDTFLTHAKRDPLSMEIGKTIFFCVSRHHCTLITRLLNESAAFLFPDKYSVGSDFAVQITSDIVGSAGRTIDFKNNKLNGLTAFNPNLPDYESCKTRVCVTVGMMTTGYDCPDVLNVVLARPIFSPTDYIQVKGRGTRLNAFEYVYKDALIEPMDKDNFYLFDFFANHDYFEKDFNYKDKIELPLISSSTGGGGGVPKPKLYYTGDDDVSSVAEQQFDRYNMMRVDKEAFSKKFEDEAKEEIAKQPELVAAVDAENWEVLWAYIKTHVFEKPNEYWNMDKIQEIYDADRRLTPTEIMMRFFCPITKLKRALTS